MSVTFYLQDQRYWGDEDHRLNLANNNFVIVRDLLDPTSDDYTDIISADTLLMKIARARTTLSVQGKEWERSEEPPPEEQEDQPFKILGTPGIFQDHLHWYLETLHRIALYAREKGTGVQWS
jgi:hypothetical protein